MKSKKWLWVTLTIFLTLIVLAGVAGAGFRMGVMQGANPLRNSDGELSKLPSFGRMHGFENDFNNQLGRDLRMMQGFSHRGLARGHGGFFSPLLGLVHLMVLGGLIWLGFRLIQNSGWKLTRVAQPAPAASEALGVDEKKE